MSNANLSLVSRRVWADECAIWESVWDVGRKLGESKSDLVAVNGSGI